MKHSLDGHIPDQPLTPPDEPEIEVEQIWVVANTKGGNEVNELAEIREDELEDFFTDLRDLINAYSVDKHIKERLRKRFNHSKYGLSELNMGDSRVFVFDSYSKISHDRIRKACYAFGKAHGMKFSAVRSNNNIIVTRIK